MAAVADFAVDMGKVTCGPRSPFQALVLRKICGPRKRATALESYDTIEAGLPSVTSTISGGTPSRNGTMLQPRPPEMMTSLFILTWP